MSDRHGTKGKARRVVKPRAAAATAARAAREAPRPAGRELGLAGVNLNALVALDALLIEGSVTRAAARAGVTQSAMSHALKQLRETFGDPLLVRGHGGLVLTPRAEELAAPLRHGLREIERAIQSEPGFDPARARRRFTIATSDWLALVLLPSLLELIGDEAPGIGIDVRPIDTRRTALLLEAGDLDLEVGVSNDDAAGIVQQKLFRETFVCLVRSDHPTVRARLSLDDYLALPHALISPKGEGPSVVDTALARIGKARRVALRVPYFLTAPLVVARSNLVLTAPRRIAEELARSHPLRVLPPPIELDAFTVGQLWHERYSHDPGHRWLRAAVARAAKRQTG